MIVPITRDDPAPVLEAAAGLERALGEAVFGGAPIRASVDGRDRKPAEKRWEWIRKGVPVIVELGERDIEQGVVTVTRRDSGDLSREPLAREGAEAAIEAMLAEIQQGYLREATERLAARTTTEVSSAEEFREWFSGEEAEAGGFVRAPWSEDPKTAELMAELGVSVRCIPFDAEPPSGAKCVISGQPAKVEAIFAKAY